MMQWGKNKHYYFIASDRQQIINEVSSDLQNTNVIIQAYFSQSDSLSNDWIHKFTLCDRRVSICGVHN